MTAIVSAGFSKFGKRDCTIYDLALEACRESIRKYGDMIDTVIVSNSYSGEFLGTSGINNLLATYLSIEDVPSVRADNTSGSGGSAISLADSLIRSGDCGAVMVLGAEKMTGFPTKKSTSVIASLLPAEERDAGVTLPSLAAFMARAYMAEFGATRESIGSVAVKNHHNGSLNPNAHLQKEVTLDIVLGSRMIADPLRLYDYCPVSDGAASLILTSDALSDSAGSRAVRMLGKGAGSSSASVSTRIQKTSISAVQSAADAAFRSSHLKPSDVHVAELHDMATVLEIVESEDIGFFKKGEGWKAVMDGTTALDGRLPLNTSGGLNSKGHPIGATGVAQAGEIFLQLTGRAGGRQVKNATVGLTANMAGFGNGATVMLYGV